MSYKTTDSGGILTLFLSGEIDLDGSPAARKALLAAVASGKPVVVDMEEVSYMDSSGIASLVEAFQKASASKLDFSLVRVGDRVRKVLQLARLDQVFKIS